MENRDNVGRAMPTTFPGINARSQEIDSPRHFSMTKLTPSFLPVTRGDVARPGHLREPGLSTARRITALEENYARNVAYKSASSQRSTDDARYIRNIMPHIFWSAFPYETFNTVQSHCLEAYQESINMVVSAPTGSGKTVIFEMAICRLLQAVFSQSNSNRVNLTSKIM